MKVNKRVSKRMSIKDKNKIGRKVREYHRKQRREGRKNPLKFKKKDPGIPNAWPFKQELLAEVEAAREEARAEQERARAYKEKMRARAAREKATRHADAHPSPREMEASALATALCNCDVLLVLVDARDPPAGLCRAIERQFVDLGRERGRSSHVVVVLTKSELVPRDNLQMWLKVMRAHGVAAVPFAVSSDASAPHGMSRRQQAIHAQGASEICELLAKLAQAGHGAEATDNALFRAGVVAGPGIDVDKVLRALQLRLRLKGPARGQVKLLESPGIFKPADAAETGLPASNPTAGILSFSMRPSKRSADLVHMTQLVLDRCVNQVAISKYFEVPRFDGNAVTFLKHLARVLELPGAGEDGEADAALAGLAFLEHWRLSRIPFCSRPPRTTGEDKHVVGTLADCLAGTYTEDVEAQLLASIGEVAGATTDVSHIVITPSDSGVVCDEAALTEEITVQASRSQPKHCWI